MAKAEGRVWSWDPRYFLGFYENKPRHLDTTYGYNAAQGQPCLGQGSLEVFVITFSIIWLIDDHLMVMHWSIDSH